MRGQDNIAASRGDSGVDSGVHSMPAATQRFVVVPPPHPLLRPCLLLREAVLLRFNSFGEE